MKNLLPIGMLTFALALSVWSEPLARAQAAAPAPSDSAAAKKLSIPLDQENARKAHELLDQAIQALGGPAYLGVHDMQEQGRTYSFYHGTPSGNGVFFWRFVSIPTRSGSNLLRSATSPTSTAATRRMKSPTRVRARSRKKILKTIGGATDSLWRRYCDLG